MKLPSRRTMFVLAGYSLVAICFHVPATQALLRLTLAGEDVLLLWLVWLFSVFYLTYLIDKTLSEEKNK